MSSSSFKVCSISEFVNPFLLSIKPSLTYYDMVWYSFHFPSTSLFIKYSYHLYFLKGLSHPSFASLLSLWTSIHCDNFKYHLSMINFHTLVLTTKPKFLIACSIWPSRCYLKFSVSKIKHFLSAFPLTGTCSPSHPGSKSYITLFSLNYLFLKNSNLQKSWEKSTSTHIPCT